MAALNRIFFIFITFSFEKSLRFPLWLCGHQEAPGFFMSQVLSFCFFWDAAILIPYSHAFQSPFEEFMVFCCGCCRRLSDRISHRNHTLFPCFLNGRHVKIRVYFWFIIFHCCLKLHCVQYYNCEWCKLTITCLHHKYFVYNYLLNWSEILINVSINLNIILGIK